MDALLGMQRLVQGTHLTYATALGSEIIESLAKAGDFQQ